MDSETHHVQGAAVTRFHTDRGNVIVIVRPCGEDAEVEVYEEAACLSGVGKSDDEFAISPQVASARNRFGTGRMLKILNEVRAANPWVRTWRGRRIPAGRV